MNFKKISLLYLVFTVIPFVGFFILLYLYDPLSIFHNPFTGRKTFHGNFREQNLSLIKYADFDSLIIGNSHSKNTSAKEAGRLFGGTFINLSMDGSSLYERSFVLDYALRHKTMRTVIGIVTPYTSRKGHGDYPVENWSFLYDDDPFNDIKIYLNSRYLRCLAKWSASPQCVGRRADIMDRPFAWHENPSHSSRFGGIDNWVKYHKHSQLYALLHESIPATPAEPPSSWKQPSAKQLAEIRSIIQDFLVQPAQKYPDTDFYYFFSPYHILSLSMAYHNNHFIYDSWLREAVHLCSGMKNIRLFGFDNEHFTEDISYYKDLSHYSPDINSYILSSMKQGNNILTTRNIDEYIALLKKRAAAYDIGKVQEYLRRTLPE